MKTQNHTAVNLCYPYRNHYDDVSLVSVARTCTVRKLFAGAGIGKL